MTTFNNIQQTILGLKLNQAIQNQTYLGTNIWNVAQRKL